MWAVSDRFLNAIGKPHDVATEVTFTPPGGVAVRVRLKAGTITVDSQSNYRRTGSLSIFGTRADYEMLTLPGGVLRINHGINFGTTQELVPVFTGEIVDGAQELGNGTISCRIADLSKWLDRTRFSVPYSPVPGTLRKSVISDVVTSARPGTSVTVTASDTGQVFSGVWRDSRLRLISDLRTDGGMEAFFLPDGTYLIRDQLTVRSAPVWTVKPGSQGVLKSAARRRPMDKLYNTVIVHPAATDGSQAWADQKVEITDTAHPNHKSKIGESTTEWDSPTVTSSTAAIDAARLILERVSGATETLELGLLSNPALEAGDPLRVVTPQVGLEAADIYQHFLDSYTLDLISGGMSASTRSQVANV